MSITTTWPPASGLFTPTVPRQDVILPIHASIAVSAPAAVVWQVLTDTAAYSQWNSFVPKVTIHSQPSDADGRSTILRRGTSLTFHVIMNPAKPTSEYPTRLRVTDTSTPSQPSEYLSKETMQDPVHSADLSQVYRISWRTEEGYMERGLRGERFHEIIVTGENQCEVRTWECMGGVLARAVKWMYASTLQQRFKEWCEDLKRASEELATKGTITQRQGYQETMT